MEAYIIKGYRSAITKSKKGSFKNFRSDDLSVIVIKHLLKQFPEINPKLVDHIYLIHI